MADAESSLRSQRDVVFGQPGEWLQLAIIKIGRRARCVGIALYES